MKPETIEFLEKANRCLENAKTNLSVSITEIAGRGVIRDINAQYRSDFQSRAVEFEHRYPGWARMGADTHAKIEE